MHRLRSGNRGRSKGTVRADANCRQLESGMVAGICCADGMGPDEVVEADRYKLRPTPALRGAVIGSPELD